MTFPRPEILIIALLALLLTACASGSAIVTGTKRTPLNPSEVRLYLEAPASFEVIGLVNASSDGGWTEQESQDYAVQELKSQAAKLGANGVLLEKTGERTSIVAWYGTGTYHMIPVIAKTVSGKAIFVRKMSQPELAALGKNQEEQKTSMTDGTVAYQTKIASNSGDIIKLENGAIVEVSSYFGYLGYRKSAVLYGSDYRYNIWIAGKKSYKCELLKAPQGRGDPAKVVHISEVKGNGTILIMLDGSIYKVDSIDEIYTSLWLGISDGILINGTILINFDSDEAVTVYRIK